MRKVLLIGMGLVFGLLLAEGLLRLYLAVAPTPTDSRVIPHPEAGYLYRPSLPGSYSGAPDSYINSLGFRDREHRLVKPPATYRILGIGDSFVYGVVPPRENFLKVAEARVAEGVEGNFPEVEMMLMGLGAYSPKQELGVLRSIGLGLNPDLVVLNFFVGNDVTGIPLRIRVYRGNRYFVGSPRPWLNLLRRLRLFIFVERVYLGRIRAALGHRRMEAWRKHASQDAGDSLLSQVPAPSSAPATVNLRFAQVQWKRLTVYLKCPSGRLQQLWEEAEGYLLEFDAACRQAGVPWILHVIPAEVQVDPRVRASVLRITDLSADAYDFDGPQRHLRAFAEAHGITLLDPLPALRAWHSPEARLYFPNDTHWNVRGNRMAGEMLGDFIVKRFGEALGIDPDCGVGGASADDP